MGLLRVTAQDFVYRARGGVTDGPPPHFSVYDNIPEAPQTALSSIICQSHGERLQLMIHPVLLLFANIWIFHNSPLYMFVGFKGYDLSGQS